MSTAEANATEPEEQPKEKPSAPMTFVPTGLKIHEEVIDGAIYTTTSCTASEGLILFPKLVDLVGQSGMELLMSTTDEQRENLGDNPEVVAALVSHIAKGAAGNDGLLVIKDLLKHTTCNKVKIGSNFVTENIGGDRFDEHFAGNYTHLMNVAIWVARASFGTP